jgi:hypothetical protein
MKIHTREDQLFWNTNLTICFLFCLTKILEAPYEGLNGFMDFGGFAEEVRQ